LPRSGPATHLGYATSTLELANRLESVRTDAGVNGVLLDISSPGGVITGIPEAAELTARLARTKPTVAFTADVMASAAYWIGSQANRIVAAPSSYVGSIGVYTAHTDVSGALDQAGVRVTLISAGRYKVEGNWFESLSADARAAIQSDVNDVYGWFVDAVASGRRTTAAAVRSGYGEGRVLNAQRALGAHLIDVIGGGELALRHLGVGRDGAVRNAKTLLRRLNLEQEAARIGLAPSRGRTVAELRRALDAQQRGI
jgi:signal peptide peptidase SppA